MTCGNKIIRDFIVPLIIYTKPKGCTFSYDFYILLSNSQINVRWSVKPMKCRLPSAHTVNDLTHRLNGEMAAH